MTDTSALLLLADSQLLFRPQLSPQVQQFFAARPPGVVLRAAYIGASNGHQAEFFQLACAGLEALLARPLTCEFIRTEHDIPALPVDLVLLAGGSVSTGWEFLQRPALRQWLEQCRLRPGTLIIGVSAGAIQLARGCDPEQPAPQGQTFLDWLPLFIAVHEEAQGWPSRQIWQRDAPQLDFAGIPFGGGLWCEGERCEGERSKGQLSEGQRFESVGRAALWVAGRH